MRFRSVIKQALILIAIAVVLAGIDTVLRPATLLASQSPALFTAITGKAALDLFVRNEVVFVDARSRELYGAGHIPGAFHIDTHADFDSDYAEFSKIVPLDQPLVIYCEGNSCQLSTALAIKLSERGYSKIKLYQGGWDDWTAERGPAAKGDH